MIFSLKRNFDQRNKIIEIGGLSVPMPYSRRHRDNPTTMCLSHDVNETTQFLISKVISSATHKILQLSHPF